MNEPLVAFVCVQNAGRSQMATVFAEPEQQRRNLDVHPEVANVMTEHEIDMSDRTPREIKPDELESADIVITLGCSAGDVRPANFTGNNRDWDLADPDGEDVDAVRAIRDRINQRVSTLFDELEDQIDGH